MEHAPYCERDLRVPENLETFDKKGSYLVKIKKEGVLYDYEYASHPFDVVGWDGYNYPYAFSIHDFELLISFVWDEYASFRSKDLP